MTRALIAITLAAALTGVTAGDTYTVTNTGDSLIDGTLRRCLSLAHNNPGLDTIEFNIGGGGAHEINVLTVFGNVTDPVIIDATTQPGYAGDPLVALDAGHLSGSPFLVSGGCTFKGLAIHSSGGAGIQIAGDGNTVQSCWFGTDVTGTAARGNGDAPVVDAALLVRGNCNLIGGPGPSLGNMFVDNQIGVRLTDEASDNVIRYNTFGLDVNGDELGNHSAGIQVEEGAWNSISNNTIAYCGSAGVLVRSPIGGLGDDPVGVTIQGNSIYCNDGLGIDLSTNKVTGPNDNDPLDADSGPNGFQNWPEIDYAIAYPTYTHIIGSLESAANTPYTLEFFANTTCNIFTTAEGETLIGSAGVVTDGSGHASFDVQLLTPIAPGAHVKGTATGVISGATSEFSTYTGAVQAVAAPARLYVSPGGTGPGLGWSDAMGSLADALSAAATAPGITTEIWMAAGTERPTAISDRTISFELRNGLAVYGGFAGTETLFDERDLSVNTTILCGDIGVGGDDSDNSHHVVVSSGMDATAVLDGFVIENGHADGSFPSNFAGGLYVNGGGPTIRNCVFRDNQGNIGGAAANLFASTTYVNCLFHDNSTTGAGGAIENQVSNTNVISCTIVDNTAGSGGGIRLLNNANMNLVNTILWGNTDGGGAGESAQIAISNAAPSVNHCVIQGLTGGLGGVGNAGHDPLLSAGYNLMASSPAIDAGDNAAVPAAVTLDLDGNLRITDGDGDATATVDVGAYETAEAEAPIPGDTNGDEVVDVDDLNNVILDWGTDGSANGGDVTGPLPGSSPDGFVNVNDLNAVIVGWGASP